VPPSFRSAFQDIREAEFNRQYGIHDVRIAGQKPDRSPE
jgi:hypothetical protein